MSIKPLPVSASKSSELLLTENDSRYVMFPIQDNDIWKMYKKQVDCFWRAEEIDLSKDIIEWNNDILNENEKFFISMKHCGNTVSSTIPIALHDAMQHGRMDLISNCLLEGFGVGYSWAACYLKINK